MLILWKRLFQLINGNKLYRLGVILISFIFIYIILIFNHQEIHIGLIFTLPINFEEEPFFKLIGYNLFPILYYLCATFLMLDIFSDFVSKENPIIKVRNLDSLLVLFIHFIAILLYSILVSILMKIGMLLFFQKHIPIFEFAYSTIFIMLWQLVFTCFSLIGFMPGAYMILFISLSVCSVIAIKFEHQFLIIGIACIILMYFNIIIYRRKENL